MFCGNCGSINENTNKFCVHCGSPLAKVPKTDKDTESSKFVLSQGAAESLHRLKAKHTLLKKKKNIPETIEISVRFMSINNKLLRKVFDGENGPTGTFSFKVPRESSREDWIHALSQLGGVKESDIALMEPTSSGYVAATYKTAEDLMKRKTAAHHSQLKIYVKIKNLDRRQLSRAFNGKCAETVTKVTKLPAEKKDPAMFGDGHHRHDDDDDDDDDHVEEEVDNQFGSGHPKDKPVEEKKPFGRVSMFCPGSPDLFGISRKLNGKTIDIVEEMVVKKPEARRIAVDPFLGGENEDLIAGPVQKQELDQLDEVRQDVRKPEPVKQDVQKVNPVKQASEKPSTSKAIYDKPVEEKKPFGRVSMFCPGSPDLFGISRKLNGKTIDTVEEMVVKKPEARRIADLPSQDDLLSSDNEDDVELERFINVQSRLEERQRLASLDFTQLYQVAKGPKQITVVYQAYNNTSLVIKVKPEADIQVLYDYICMSIDWTKLAAKFHLRDRNGNSYHSDYKGCLGDLSDVLFIEEEEYSMDDTMTNYGGVSFK